MLCKHQHVCDAHLIHLHSTVAVDYIFCSKFSFAFRSFNELNELIEKQIKRG